MTSYEVAVIGAGIHGASAAFHLASRGVRTVVVERGEPAGGPTGRSSAVCRAYYTNDFLARVAREGIDMFAEFAEMTGGRDAGFVRTGALFLHPPEDGPQLRDATERLNAIGTKTELLELEEVAARFPSLDLHGVGWAGWEADAGYADPAGATHGLLARALELGAELLVETPVMGIEQTSGGLTLDVGQGRRIGCDRLLVAAGPWTRPLAAQVGADLPLGVERHIVATFRWGGAERLPFVLADVPRGYYLKPEGAEQYFLGPLHAEPPCDPDDFPAEVADSEVIDLAEAAIGRVPPLAESETSGGWASLYDVSPDWQPVIGEIADSVFVDAGTSGHGFKLAPALGRHVADLVTGAPVDPGLAQFHPRRFSEAGALSGGYGAAKILG